MAAVGFDMENGGPSIITKSILYIQTPQAHGKTNLSPPRSPLPITPPACCQTSPHHLRSPNLSSELTHAPEWHSSEIAPSSSSRQSTRKCQAIDTPSPHSRRATHPRGAARQQCGSRPRRQTGSNAVLGAPGTRTDVRATSTRRPFLAEEKMQCDGVKDKHCAGPIPHCQISSRRRNTAGDAAKHMRAATSHTRTQCHAASKEPLRPLHVLVAALPVAAQHRVHRQATMINEREVGRGGRVCDQTRQDGARPVARRKEKEQRHDAVRCGAAKPTERSTGFSLNSKVKRQMVDARSGAIAGRLARDAAACSLEAPPLSRPFAGLSGRSSFV